MEIASSSVGTVRRMVTRLTSLSTAVSSVSNSPVDSLIVVALDRRFVAHFQFIFFKIFADVCLDRVTDAVLKIGKGIAALICDLQMGSVDQCFGSDQPGLRQLIDNLLQCQVIGVFFFPE